MHSKKKKKNSNLKSQLRIKALPGGSWHTFYFRMGRLQMTFSLHSTSPLSLQVKKQAGKPTLCPQVRCLAQPNS